MLLFSDVSDNQAPPITPYFIGMDGVFLKLYPLGHRGRPWFIAALTEARRWQETHSEFLIGFYAADSTPTWATAMFAARTANIDLAEHPFAFDLREFGYDQDHVKKQIAASKAAGVRTGLYWRLDEHLGQGWNWVARYLPDEPHFNWHLWQYTSKPFDHSKSPLTLEQFKKLTIAAYVPPKPPKEGFLMALTDEEQQYVYNEAVAFHFYRTGLAKSLGVDLNVKGANQVLGEKMGAAAQKELES